MLNSDMPPSLPAPVGRFAPTPSGPLHLGSLVAALGSYLQARAQGGRWRLRIDDLDTGRCQAEAITRIPQQLLAHGLAWDGDIVRQSDQLPRYRAALARLQESGHLYPCSCTRARLASTQRPGPDDPVYDGQCRRQPAAAAGRHALRLRLAPGRDCVEDPALGRLCRDLASEVGDFTVRRSDGAIGYQLACAVDEQELGITEVVRGADLLGSAFRQRALMRALAWTPPAYRHLPVLVGADGAKLSKQNHAEGLQDAQATANLRRCLAVLGQDPPPPGADRPGAVVAAALERWNARRIPPRLTVCVHALPL